MGAAAHRWRRQLHQDVRSHSRCSSSSALWPSAQCSPPVALRCSAFHAPHQPPLASLWLGRLIVFARFFTARHRRTPSHPQRASTLAIGAVLSTRGTALGARHFTAPHERLCNSLVGPTDCCSPDSFVRTTPPPAKRFSPNPTSRQAHTSSPVCVHVRMRALVSRVRPQVVRSADLELDDYRHQQDPCGTYAILTPARLRCTHVYPSAVC